MYILNIFWLRNLETVHSGNTSSTWLKVTRVNHFLMFPFMLSLLPSFLSLKHTHTHTLDFICNTSLVSDLFQTNFANDGGLIFKKMQIQTDVSSLKVINSQLSLVIESKDRMNIWNLSLVPKHSFQSLLPEFFIRKQCFLYPSL